MEKQVKSQRFTVHDLVIVGVTAAIIFALTYLVRIEIPTPVGPTNLKLANAFILIFAMLFGGLKGGPWQGGSAPCFSTCQIRLILPRHPLHWFSFS